MKITFKGHSTLPTKKSPYSQIVFLPSISLFRNINRYDLYYALMFEWLFWSITILFRTDGKSKTE
jgi:hypothetical protein